MNARVERLCKQIREQGAVLILYATWAYQKDGAKLAAKVWDYDEMARKLAETYHKAAEENHALIADVGQRFMNCQKHKTCTLQTVFIPMRSAPASRRRRLRP